MSIINTVIFFDQERGEQQAPLKRGAIISITDHDRPLATLHTGWTHILRLQFDDIDFPHLRSPSQQKLLTLYEEQFSTSAKQLGFQESHVQQIKSWLSQIENEVSIIIVHCKRGESRSAAVAKFICKKYGLDFDESYNKYNKWVYHLLTQKMQVTTNDQPAKNTMNCIGLDWDGVVSDYPSAFGFLVGLFDFCVIITVNHTITVDFASNILSANSGKIIVEICPDDRIDDYPIWKAEICERHKVNIMFDDNPDVVCACQKLGIFAITISEYIYRFQTPEVFWFQK